VIGLSSTENLAVELARSTTRVERREATVPDLPMAMEFELAVLERCVR
jgi:hypothetical protein